MVSSGNSHRHFAAGCGWNHCGFHRAFLRRRAARKKARSGQTSPIKLIMVSSPANSGSGGAGNMNQPLSQSLAEILREDSAAGLTLNRLLERTQGRGLFLVIILLCLPFIVPVSLPGLSTLMGSIIL